MLCVERRRSELAALGTDLVDQDRVDRVDAFRVEVEEQDFQEAAAQKGTVVKRGL
jgi:hypothetical protein